MTDYYCDLSEGTFADRTGADSSANVLTGPAGFQAAIRGTGNATALAAGDTLYLKGTGDQSRLVWLDVDTDVSSWPLNASVRNDTGSPDEWIGVVVQVNYKSNNDQILVWLNDGFTESDIDLSHGIYYSVGPWNQGLDAKDTKGIEIDTNSGSTGSPISFVGVNSSWAEDGTQATLDGNDLANANITNAGKDWLNFRNTTSKDSAGNAFEATSAATECHFANCIADNPATGGFEYNGGYWQWSTFYRCKAFGFTTYGWRVYQTSLFGCAAWGGTGGCTGMYLNASAASNCVAFEQADGYGVNMLNGSQLVNCVLDANKYGLTLTDDAQQIVGSRITNNTTYGIAGAKPVTDLYCYYSGNGANFQNDIHLDEDDGSSTRTTTGTVGYIDSDNATLADRNYGLTNQAAARRQEVAL